MVHCFTENLVDVTAGQIYLADVTIAEGHIQSVQRLSDRADPDRRYLMPGFVDSHIHIESSMLMPASFAQIAVIHGTVATVSDPHEIANVCGIDGVRLMLRDAEQSPLKFCFGAPSCVPATPFETAGQTLGVDAVTQLLDDPQIGYLSEVMDFPGVLQRSPQVMAKIQAAVDRGKPIDGHAPGLRGDQAAKYVAVGITTDHECFALEEAVDKLHAGCKIAIREGSAARNFDALHPLIDSHPDQVMLCSDDKHPDELMIGHINQLVARAVSLGHELMNVLKAACVNPVRHYGLNVGMLRPGDPADFILVDNLIDFVPVETWINGTPVAKNGTSLLSTQAPEVLNCFLAQPISADQLVVPAAGQKVRVIQAIDGQLVTDSVLFDCPVDQGQLAADPAADLLKLVVVNRYVPDAMPSVAMVKGFGLKSGAIASSVAHDSHNIVAVGASDNDLVSAINAVIEQRGGLSVSAGGNSDVLPLPIAGLMSPDSCQRVAQQYQILDQAAKQLGCTLRSPYMTLSFMALLVIPSLKLSDKGLFDGQQFEFTSLFPN